jgi:acyl carrier protein
MHIGKEIESIILEEVAPESGVAMLDPKISLIANQVLDSLALLRLVIVIEERFGITVEDGELIPDNFETINNMEKFIETKRRSM